MKSHSVSSSPSPSGNSSPLGGLCRKLSPRKSDNNNPLSLPAPINVHNSTFTPNVIGNNELQRVFNCFDEDGDGKISPAELRSCITTVGGQLSIEEAEAAVSFCDMDGDGLLGFQDFQCLMAGSAFQQQSIIMQHGVFTLLVGTLISLIQVKYQSSKASPFDSHDAIMSVLLAALCTYATASVAEVKLLARETPYGTLAGNLRLFAGALAAISLLAILDPILGFITSAVWACLFMAVAYKSRTEIRKMFTRLAASVRTREEQPNQPRV